MTVTSLGDFFPASILALGYSLCEYEGLGSDILILYTMVIKGPIMFVTW